MSHTPKISRRAALAGAAALPLAAAATSTRAAAPMLGASQASFKRVTLGGFEVTNLLAGSAVREDPQSIFGMNVDKETFEAVSNANNLPLNAAQFFFTPVVVNTGSELILFDTGLNPAGTTSALEAAGYTDDQVDKVVITHMHGDHIGGLQTDGTPTYGNAQHYAGAVEMNHWAGAENERFDGIVKPLMDQFTMVDDGASIASGVTSMAAFGHTPGHMVYMLESDGAQLLLGADFANHFVWSLGYPDWEVRFDMDKAAAAATRKTLLDMMATDGVPFSSYHMPWPAFGYVERAGEGYRYTPHSYQLTL
ncbi:MBL fold metallo-hydrolase [Tateyamaria sp. SN6-1]|uniref:MBL fold metallo-hydrolase n=1 Tax=Tateyamaria sp. SN6-1 TaxID=3092148 RepID=UPI0039F4E3FB